MATIHHVLPVPPLSNSPNETESSLPLTFFDTFWLKFPPVERLFFYRLTDLTHQIFASEILPKLKHSLSQTLLHYPPLAGQIKWPLQHPIPSIFYSSTDSVSVTVAESNAHFDSLSSNHVHEATELRALIPELFTSHDVAELISIQITLFPNKGFSIGVSTHHAILDGKSSTNIVKSWAYLCKTEQHNLPTELTPSFDRTVINDPEGAAAVSFVENWFALGGQFKSEPRSLKVLPSMSTEQNSVRATFVMSRDDLNELRNKIREYAMKQSKEIHLSTFVVSYAYVVYCMTKAEADKERELAIGFTADYRARMEPPLPSNYFGNCVMTQFFPASAGKIVEEDGVSVAAEKLSEAVKGLEGKNAIKGLDELFVHLKTLKPGAKIIGVAGSNKFGVYGTDFGWGRPEKVEIVSIDRTGAISLAESGDGKDGVEIGVVLEKHQMQAFARLFHQGV